MALAPRNTDPYNKYVLTSRVRTGRSVRTFKLPPTISFGERRALEKLVTGALLDMVTRPANEKLGSAIWPFKGQRDPGL